MKRYLILCLAFVLLGSAQVSWGQDFEKAKAAYDRYDWEIALQEFKPLAEQGHPEAQFYLGLLYRTKATAIEIYPGEEAQMLHRDGDCYPISIPGVEFQVQVMWALSDFTVENGATRLVLDRDVLKGVKNCETEAFENIDESKVAQAVMPKGSAFYWLQSTIHGGGANKASTPRSGLFVSYSLGWVRQEDNHYLMLPREVVDSYPDQIRRLVGYQSNGKYLGIYPGDPDGKWWDA